MINSDILIRIRYALDIKDIDIIEIFKLGGVQVSKEEVVNLFTKSQEEDESETDQGKCTKYMLESFLNGLIIFKRGKQETKDGSPANPEMIMNNKNVNNVMLKKLKIALALSSDDMLEIFEMAGVTISKGELSALFRKEGHRNYRECGDRYARNFLKGLTLKYRKN